MHVANSEIAAARNANTGRSHHGRRAGPTALGSIVLAVFVAAVVRAFTGALPLQFAAQPLAALAAQCSSRGLSDVGERDRSLFVGVRKEIDVITLEDYLLARHFLVCRARQAALGGTR